MDTGAHWDEGGRTNTQRFLKNFKPGCLMIIYLKGWGILVGFFSFFPSSIGFETVTPGAQGTFDPWQSILTARESVVC